MFAISCPHADHEPPENAGSIATLQRAGVHLMDPDTVTIRRDDGTVTADWSAIAQRLDQLVSPKA